MSETSHTPAGLNGFPVPDHDPLYIIFEQLLEVKAVCFQAIMTWQFPGQ